MRKYPRVSVGLSLLRSSALTSFLLMALPLYATAGAWLRAPNESYAKVGVSNFQSNEIYGPKSNQTLPGPDFSDTTTFIYAEYGWSPSWTGALSVSHKNLRRELGGRSNTTQGYSDLWLFAKRGLSLRPFVVSVQAGLKSPLGYSRSENPPLGDGQIDWEGRVLVGRSVGFLSGYVNVEAAYRKRNGDVSDEFPYRLETGARTGRNVTLTLALDGVSSRSNDTASTTGNRAPNVFDEEYMTLGPGLIVSIGEGVAFEFNYDRTIAGGNTAVGNKFSLAFSWINDWRPAR
jgi:protein XagA